MAKTTQTKTVAKPAPTEAQVESVIGYLRVSTSEQGKSGLGLDAQLAAIQTYCDQTGATLLKVYKEIESGGKSDRPEMAKAIAHANRSRSVIITSTLDRLSREVHFIATLMKRGIKFRCADAPNDDETMIYIRATFAERERLKISQRTKAALAQLKERGVALGGHRPNSHKFTDQQRQAGAIAGGQRAQAKAMQAYADLTVCMLQWHRDGLSQATIATKLNEDGHSTRYGKAWSQVQVGRVLRRYCEV